MNRIIISVLALAISGCVSERVISEVEDTAAAKHLNAEALYQGRLASLDQLTDYAFDLSRQYESKAAEAALGRDVVVSLLFAAAGSTVLGTIDGISDSSLAKRALVGVTVNEAGKYASPASASQAIYKAAKQMNCIGTQGAAFVALDDADTNTQTQARAATFGAIREVQIELKEGIKRTPPDFSALRQALQSGISGLRSGLPNGLSQLKTALASCISEN